MQYRIVDLLGKWPAGIAEAVKTDQKIQFGEGI